ncbi:MAG: hypothetical protein AB7K09_20435 [Planctomycetota bacterium]
MITIVARLWIAPGLDAAFRDYERRALALFGEHGGEVVAAFEPRRVGGADGECDEVHVLRIATDAALAAWRADPRVAALADERARVIARSEVIISARDVDVR